MSAAAIIFQLVSESNLEFGTEIDLGDGYTLKNHGGSWTSLWRWKVWKDGDLACSICLSKTPDSEIWAIQDIEAFHRGKGLGRRSIKALLDRGLKLRSSPYGNTSGDAEKMWKTLGARSLRYDDKGFGKSWYALPNPPDQP